MKRFFAGIALALIGLSSANALFLGKADPGSGSPYPTAVINAGIQVAWDIAPNGVVDTTKVGPQSSYCTATYGGMREINAAGVVAPATVPTGWSVSTAGLVRSNSLAPDNPLECWIITDRTIVVEHSTNANTTLIRHNQVFPGATTRGCLTLGFGGITLEGVLFEYNECSGLPDDSTFGELALSADYITENASYHLNNNSHIIRYNYFHGGGQDNIKIRSYGTIIENNYFGPGGRGWNSATDCGAHYDAIDVGNFKGAGAGSPVIIRNNFFNFIMRPNDYGPTSSVAIYNAPNGVTLSYNYFHYGARTNLTNGYVSSGGVCTFDAPAYPFYTLYSVGVFEAANTAIWLRNSDNITVNNNVFDYDIAAIYTTTRIGFSAGAWSNNYFADGTLITPTLTDTYTPTGSDDEPTVGAFVDQTGVATNTLITSAAVTPTGFDERANVRVYCESASACSCAVSTDNGSTWSSATTTVGGVSRGLAVGAAVVIRQTSSTLAGTERVCKIGIGKGGAWLNWPDWSVTTAP